MSAFSKRLRPIGAATTLFVLAGCNTAEDVVADAKDRVVNLFNTPAGPSTSGTIPPLSNLVLGGGAFPPDVPGGVYTNGFDLNNNPSSNAATWRASVTSDPFSAQPALDPLLSSAQTMAENRESEISTAAISAMFSGLGGSASVTRTTAHAGYEPVQARWQSSDTETCADYPNCPLTTTPYPDPAHFDELRMRGARLYCAAREAVMNQPGSGVTMGSRSAGGLDIFGQRIDFMVIEPTAVVHPPERFLDTANVDGAQAFAVPLSLGTRFSPIRGLGIPSFPEVRTPVTFVVGDTEVENASEQLEVNSEEPIYGKTHHTVTFGEDVVSSQWNAEGTFPPIPLFDIFIFKAQLQLGLEMFAGDGKPITDAVLASPPLTFSPPRPGTPPYTWETYGTAGYYDGTWSLASTVPGTSPIFVNANGVGDFLAPNDPFLTRAIQDADYGRTSRAGMTMSGALLGSAGIDVGLLALQFNIEGGLEGTGQMVHDVRDAERASLRPDFEPTTGLVVTPHMEADLSFASKAWVHAKVLFASWDFTIYDYTTTLASYEDDPWPEANRLRIGTSARSGDVTSQPDVLSHFPGHPEFASFPSTVQSCIEGEVPELPETPPPCEPSFDPGSTPSAEICVYGDMEIEGACEDRSAALETFASNEAEAQCIDAFLDFLCQPVSQEQNHATRNVIARVVENDAAFGNELAGVVAICGEVFGEEWVQENIGFGVCDASATLFEPGTAVTPAPAGEPSGPGTCL